MFVVPDEHMIRIASTSLACIKHVFSRIICSLFSEEACNGEAERAEGDAAATAAAEELEKLGLDEHSEARIRRHTMNAPNYKPTGWAFGHYVLGFVQGLPETAQNCPKLIIRKYIVKIILFSIKIN